MTLYVRRSSPASPAAPPAAPAAPSISAADTALTATWSAPSDGGSPITSYDRRHSVTAAETWTTVTGVTSPSTISTLTNGTSYDVQVRALNAAGTGAWSVSGVGTPSAASMSVLGTATVHGVSAPTVTVPGAPDSGDALVFWSVADVFDAVGAVTWTAPAGSTLVGTYEADNSKPRIRVWRKAHDATASYLFGNDKSNQSSGIVSLSAASVSMSIAGAAGYGTGPVSGGLASTPGDVFLSLVGIVGSGTISAQPSGYTAGQYSAPNFRGSGVAHKVLATTGTETPGAWTLATAESWAAVTVKVDA